MIRRAIAAFTIAACLVPLTSSASASRPYTFAFTRGAYAGPSTSDLIVPIVVLPQGTDLYLFNLNVWGHSMYSELNGLNDRLFWSELVPFGKSTLVNGVSDLQPGSYGFYCSNHEDMKGTLRIIDKEAT